MQGRRLFAVGAAVLLSSCGLIDAVENKINEISQSLQQQLIEASEGGVQQLVSLSSQSAQVAGQQLSLVSSNSANDRSSTDRAAAAARMTPLQSTGTTGADCPPPPKLFDKDADAAGQAPGMRPAQTTVRSQECAVYDPCVVVTRSTETIDGETWRTVQSDHSACTQTGGSIEARYKKTADERNLLLVLDAYTEQRPLPQLLQAAGGIAPAQAGTSDTTATDESNGEVSWSISSADGFTEKIKITTSEQVTIVREAPGVVTPITIESQQTLVFDLNLADKTLLINGTGNFTTAGNVSLLSFSNVLFDFDDCPNGPSEGTVKMSGGGKEFTLNIDGCGTGNSVDPEGATRSWSAAEMQQIFQASLDALNRFGGELATFAGETQKVEANNLCEADVSDDKFDEGDGNNGPADAARVILEGEPTAGGEYGIAVQQLIFTDGDWYKASLAGGRTYFVDALPKTQNALWPFVCVYKNSGTAAEPQQGEKLSIGPDEAAECFPGYAEFTLSGSADANQNVLIQVFDPLGDYQCQTYTLAVYDPDSGYVPPAPPEALDGDDGGEACPTEWIDDGVCDSQCVEQWGEEDGDDCSAGGGSGECPLYWIADGVCDQDCISIWGPDAENPDTGTANGTDDGGDCSTDGSGGSCPLEYIGDGICDDFCVKDWGPDATNPETGAANDSDDDGTGDDGGDCSGDGGDTGDTGGETDDCPLFWIGDGLCDEPCLSTWAEDPTNPDPNGDDGGDCPL